MPRHDNLIQHVREMARQRREHEHPADTEGDIYCLNVVATIGESADAILEHVDELQRVYDLSKAFCEALVASEDDGEDERCIDAGHALFIAVMGDTPDDVFVHNTNGA